MSAWPTDDELAMDKIRATWFELYDTGYADDAYLARRLTGGKLLKASTPEGLESAIRADFARSPDEVAP